MSSLLHTYGPTCQLAQNTTKPASDGDDIPRVKAQFFYTSPLPIDDPLSAVPIPNESVTRHPPRPFSAYDNKALEEAWLGLASEKDRKHHFKGNLPQWATKDDAERRAAILKRAATKKNDMKKAQEEERKAQSTMSKIESASEAVKDGVLHSFPDVGKALDDVLDISTSSTSQGQKQDKDKVKREAPKEGHKDESKEQGSQDTTKAKEKTHEKSHSGKGKHSDPIAQHDGPKDTKKSAGDKDLTDSKGKEHKASGKHSHSKSNKEHEKLQIHDLAEEARPASPTRPGQSGPAGITGNPFARVPSHKASPLSQAPTLSNRDDELHSTLDEALAGDGPPSRSASTREPSEETMQIAGCKAHRNSKEKDDVEIPVGISRLHLVKLPALQMKPIYWSPIHDGAAVTRGTWFYKDTMLPVEPPVANQLEIGYRELRPWSQTWKDELNSALEVGAAGEEKIVHRLWPKDDEPQDSSKKFDRHGDVKSSSEPLLSTDPYCAAKCFNGEAAAVGTLEDEKPSDTATIVKRYPNSQVIYKNSSHAFILKQSLIPSAYYGRKPLTKIMRGHTVGVHVVRGFDWKTWDKLHPSKKTATTTKAEEHAPASGDANANKTATCEACRSAEERPEVTDLVLVVHGIGQKLSERVESFHFTHAINAFRRSVNIELASEAVQPVLRKGLGGVMVLPVNWRSNLSFEDGGPKKGIDKDKDYKDPDDFTLKDITPNTIPAVRSLISDVMLDIPFYMSHHKPKMIEALVTEANRVYALWNKNNPGFKNNGRVHIIAHSLGSVMALDVLSHQPSVVPKYNLGKKINAKHFDFDTTNLFFVGSPAGFFLLLERGNLSPRRGRSKPGADLEDVNSRKGTTNDEGTFGSLAVDNVYNIMHYNDPIAYRVNATVDPLYAASLKDAQVPSATTGFFQAMGKAIKSITPGVSSPTDLGVGQLSKPPAIQRLPSTLEMEVHDFTREEIAERKFFLLNDNGQVDWFLSSGGGPLEIQYINMLGAHSSYWGSPDFVRMIVTEVGRTPGKDNTLPNLRAIKVGQHKRK